MADRLNRHARLRWPRRLDRIDEMKLASPCKEFLGVARNNPAMTKTKTHPDLLEIAAMRARWKEERAAGATSETFARWRLRVRAEALDELRKVLDGDAKACCCLPIANIGAGRFLLPALIWKAGRVVPVPSGSFNRGAGLGGGARWVDHARKPTEAGGRSLHPKLDRAKAQK